MRGAEAARSAHDAGGAAGIERLERTDWREHHRQAQFAAERFDRRVDAADIAQYARPECDLVKRHPVAAQGGLGLGGPDNVVPGILVEVDSRLAHEFVKVLELFGAGAEFGGSRRPDRCRVVHGVLPGLRDSFAWSFAYRFRSFRATPKVLCLIPAGR